jgi:hypothetical protein
MKISQCYVLIFLAALSLLSCNILNFYVAIFVEVLNGNMFFG